MFKNIFSAAVFILSSQAFAEPVAVCIVSQNQETTRVYLDLPRSGHTGTHLPVVYEKLGLFYGFSLPFNHDLSQARVWKGVESNGGIAFEYFAAGDLSQSALTLIDVANAVQIQCHKP